jgi:hypothetical protein
LNLHPNTQDVRFRLEFLGVWTGFLLAESAWMAGEKLPVASQWLLYHGESATSPVAGFESLDAAFRYVATRIARDGLSGEAIAHSQQWSKSQIDNKS